MRLVLLAVLASSTAALGEPVLEEYDTTRRLVPASQLTLGACDLDVQFRGAIIDAELHQRIHNAGPAKLGTSYEVALPAAAQVIGFALRDRATALAVTVPAGPPAEVMDSDRVLGADPALVTQLDPDDRGHVVYRTILQPFAADHDVTVALHWTDVAEIHDGALHYTLPGGLGAPACMVRVTTALGPGAKVQQVRAGGTPLATTPTFTLGRDDLAVDVELAIAPNEPIAWVQSAELGDGLTARAVTVIAPPPRAEAGARHVVFVLDTSRSMELVGRPVVRSLVQAILAALPKGAEVEAILYDRTATRVLGSWQSAADAATRTAIDKALELRPAINGSDLAGALGLAHALVTERGRGQAMVVAITDGVLGSARGQELTLALAASVDDVDVHAIVLDPAHMRSPGIAALRGPVGHYGGAYVEVGVDELDPALAGMSSWLRPAWLDLAIAGDAFTAMPDQLRAGSGFVATAIARKPTAVVIRGRAEGPIAITAHAGPSAPLAQLVLARASSLDFGDDAARRARVRARHAAVDADHDLAVLSTTGRVAQSRRQMIAGGGPYTRVVALTDAAYVPSVHIGAATGPTHSAIDRAIIKRMLNDQLQPRAYSCYQRALGLVPGLAGTVHLELDLGRGEVTHVGLVGTGNATFDTCLLDAAYGMTPPLPTPGVNDDDRSFVNYSITFAVRENKPLVLPGDADSTSPLDIEAIQGGVPRHLNVDTRTPLGGLTPP
jgi:hypothetical protein